MSASGKTPQLEYAPRRETLRRKRQYRWLIILAVLCTAWYLWGYHTEMIRSVKIAWLKHQCLRHPIPEGIVVYSSDNPNAAVHSKEWDAFSGVERFGNTNIKNSTIFLGEMRSPHGSRGLVEVEAVCQSESDNVGEVSLYANVSGSDFSSGYVNQEIITREQYAGKNVPPKPDIVVTAAVFDPDNPSHIIFRYRIFGVERRVDGWYAGRDDFSMAISPAPAR